MQKREIFAFLSELGWEIEGAPTWETGLSLAGVRGVDGSRERILVRSSADSLIAWDSEGRSKVSKVAHAREVKWLSPVRVTVGFAWG